MKIAGIAENIPSLKYQGDKLELGIIRDTQEACQK